MRLQGQGALLRVPTGGEDVSDAEEAAMGRQAQGDVPWVPVDDEDVPDLVEEVVRARGHASTGTGQAATPSDEVLPALADDPVHSAWDDLSITTGQTAARSERPYLRTLYSGGWWVVALAFLAKQSEFSGCVVSGGEA